MKIENVFSATKALISNDADPSGEYLGTEELKGIRIKILRTWLW